jgi:ankyrin repeat protein
MSDAASRLLTAASAGDIDMLYVALEEGIEIDTRDEHGRTALLRAVEADQVHAAKILIGAGADPNALDDRHDTPWLLTGVTGSVAMLEALLPGKPDLNLVNRYGGVSVIPASERGHVEYVRRVVQTGINVNHVNNLGWTALLECVILGDGSQPYQEVAAILVAAGADPGIADKNGVDALTHARRRGQAEVAAILSRPARR